MEIENYLQLWEQLLGIVSALSYSTSGVCCWPLSMALYEPGWQFFYLGQNLQVKKALSKRLSQPFEAVSLSKCLFLYVATIQGCLPI